jgi:hypothetical protein
MGFRGGRGSLFSAPSIHPSSCIPLSSTYEQPRSERMRDTLSHRDLERRIEQLVREPIARFERNARGEIDRAFAGSAGAARKPAQKVPATATTGGAVRGGGSRRSRSGCIGRCARVAGEGIVAAGWKAERVGASCSGRWRGRAITSGALRWATAADPVLSKIEHEPVMQFGDPSGAGGSSRQEREHVAPLPCGRCAPRS